MQTWNMTRLIIATLFLVFTMPATHQAICVSGNSPIQIEAQKQTEPENPEKEKRKIKRNYDNLILKTIFGFGFVVALAYGSFGLTFLLFTHPVTAPIGVAAVLFVSLLYRKAYRSMSRKVDRKSKRGND